MLPALLGTFGSAYLGYRGAKKQNIASAQQAERMMAHQTGATPKTNGISRENVKHRSTTPNGGFKSCGNKSNTRRQ